MNNFTTRRKILLCLFNILTFCAILLPSPIFASTDSNANQITSAQFECPLNGKFYPEENKKLWMHRLPMAVMLDNHPEARPQSGISSADIVFEAMMEGGATFYMPVFFCDVGAKDVTIAPIRSARSYFIDWANGFYNPLYVHVGGANLEGPTNALGKIDELGWTGKNDFNQFSLGYPTFTRNYERLAGRDVPTEYTMQTSAFKLWSIADDRSLGTSTDSAEPWVSSYHGWSYEEKPAKIRSTISVIEYEFWDGLSNFAVKWIYDKESHKYLRFIGNEVDTDLNNKQQIHAANVILLYTEIEGPIDEKKHLLYRTTGEGKAVIYNDNGETTATWKKPESASELVFVDSNGAPVKLARGLTWISAVDRNSLVKTTVLPLNFLEKIYKFLLLIFHQI